MRSEFPRQLLELAFGFEAARDQGLRRMSLSGLETNEKIFASAPLPISVGRSQ